MLYAACISFCLAFDAISVVRSCTSVSLLINQTCSGLIFFIMLSFGKSLTFGIQNSANHLWTATIFAFIPVIYALALLEIPESPTYLMKRVGRKRLRTSYITLEVFVTL